MQYKIAFYGSIAIFPWKWVIFLKDIRCLQCGTGLTISLLQQPYMVLLKTVSAIKRNQLLLEWHCRLKALQVHTQFCSGVMILSCKWGMMQKMNETEFKEQ